MSEEYTFSEEELNELKKAFFHEAYEILQSLQQDTANLEAGREPKASLTNIKRHYHTFKGNSQAMGFSSLHSVTLRSESLLKKVLEQSSQAEQDLIALIRTINDTLRRYVDGYQAGSDVPLDRDLVRKIEGHLEISGGE